MPPQPQLRPTTRPEEPEPRPRQSSQKRVAPTTAAESIGEVDTRTASVGDATTFTDYITVGKATADATCGIAPAAVTDAPPPSR